MRELIQSILKKIYPYFQQIEMALWAGVAVGLLLRLTSIPSETVLVVSCSSLAVLYFLSTYQTDVVKTGQEKSGFLDLIYSTIVPKASWMSLAVGSIGILFYVTHKKGYQEMLQLGLYGTAITTILLFIGMALNKNYSKANIPVLYRTIPLMLVSLYLLWSEGGQI